MPPAEMTVPAYQAIWEKADLTERSGAQSNFRDLCAVVRFPTPPEKDPAGRDYAFERLVHRRDGRPGYADVWHRGRWAWEYKRRGADLDAAYDVVNGRTVLHARRRVFAAQRDFAWFDGGGTNRSASDRLTGR